MLDMPSLAAAVQAPARPDRRHLRMAVIGVVSFLTLVDLFAAQAVLPALTAAYGVSPATMGLAVNACTFGMAAAGLSLAVAGDRIGRRTGIVASLALLSIPTALLAIHPPLGAFTGLRIAQGVFMASAFTLTMAYLAEHADPDALPSALAAYVTGNVASNLAGRLLSAGLVDHYGLAANFLVLAGLNIVGAALVWSVFQSSPSMRGEAGSGGMRKAATWVSHLRNPPLAAIFAIGFLILFAFVGTFTYVNFVLVRAPLALGQMSLGLVYLVFVPALVVTPLMGHLSRRIGPTRALRLSFVTALAGLPLLIVPWLPAVLAGLVLAGAGTFAAQAAATGLVGRLAVSDRGGAGGLYLAAYYLGGLAGSALLGRVFDSSGWPSCVAIVAGALTAALSLVPHIDASSRHQA